MSIMSGKGDALPGSVKEEHIDDEIEKTDGTKKPQQNEADEENEETKSLRRSTRTQKPSLKKTESCESQFWEVIQRCSDLAEEDLTQDMSTSARKRKVGKVQHTIEDLKIAYEQLRTVCGDTVPIVARQKSDQCNEDLKRMLHRLQADGDAISDGASVRTTSTTASKRALLAAKTAALQAKLEAKKTEDGQKLELAKLEALERARQAEVQDEIERKRQEIENQKLLTELKVAKAEIKALEESSRTGSVVSERLVLSSATAKRPIISTSPSINISRDAETAASRPISPAAVEEIRELTRTFTTSMNLSRLPAPEPNIFSGDPLTYPSWKASFSALIDSRGIAAPERIHYLKRYLSGEAKEAVEGMFYFDTEDAYNSARQILDERFGNPFLVSEAFRSRLDEWPKIHGTDTRGLRKLADYLRQCLLAIRHIPSLSILNDCRENRKILAKLPEWLVRKWSRIVAEYTEKGQYPSFEKFVSYMIKEADIACNPVNAARPLPSNANSNHSKTTRPSRTPAARTLVTDSKGPQSPPCVCCKRTNHTIGDCRDLRKKTPAERRDLLMKGGICFGCLSAGHKSKDCKKKLTCTKCKRKHPTCLCGDYEALHGTVNNKPDGARTREPTLPPPESTTLRSSTIHVNDTSTPSSMIVPVYISSKTSPHEEQLQLVYALLDTQSDTTFILDETLDTLDIPHTPTRLKLSTMTTTSWIECRKVSDLTVRAMTSAKRISLPTTYSRSFIPSNPSHIPTQEVTRKWPHLRALTSEIPPKQQCQVGLLIGYDCPEALAPIQVLRGEGNQPFGIQTELGWSVVGKTMCLEEQEEHLNHCVITKKVPSNLVFEAPHNRDEVSFVCRSKVTEEVSMPEIVRILESDFQEKRYEETAMSQDDMAFIKILKEGISQDHEGYYEMPLPFRQSRPPLPDNVQMARKRLQQLKKRFTTDQRYAEDYSNFMGDILKNGDAEEVPQGESEDGHSWFIPHHGVYHPKKPGKIRVVFDCSARWKGISLNDHLLQGPDLMNSLTGVLLRFRERPIAIMGDIERMFHQFRVKTEDRNYLKFLWWKDGNTDKEPTTYRMKVHLFGATSSPGCANFGLKKLAADHKKEYETGATDFLTNSFYVDDGLGSFMEVEETVKLVHDVRELCSKGNLRLHKFASNSQAVMASIPESEHAAEMKTFSFDESPVGRVLGMEWRIEGDYFEFRLTIPVKPMTRRGVLSTVASVYDPLGCLAPFVLLGKQVLQQLCKDNYGWDDTLSEEIRPKWERWIANLPKLASLKIRRCLIPEDFGQVKSYELHHFSDASVEGYGQCSYIRMLSEKGVFCSLVMGKACVTPLKMTTIPRLELTAAVTSLKISRFLQDEMSYQNIKHHYWIDSKVVLGYINNDARRFHVFVANRIQIIRNSSDPSQWNYVNTKENPADHASRGLYAEELMDSNWFTGPKFLWEETLPTEEPVDIEISSDDREVKKVIVNKVVTQRETVMKRLSRFSKWDQAVTAVTALKGLIRRLQAKSEATRKEGEMTIIQMIQRNAFADEIELIKQEKTLPRGSRIHQLDPFLDQDDILRVGGRLSRSSESFEIKHPIILPKSGHLVELLIRMCHEKVAHQGRGFTLNEIRTRGYWIQGGNKTVATQIFQCVICRKLRGSTLTQKMADLPIERLEVSPPFTHCGMDCFGPFIVKEGRREIKRYGLIMTCMASRAVHVELLDDMTTDAFINGLRCVMAIRGPINSLRCDQGSNFIGAQRELQEAHKEIKEEMVRKFLEANQCQFIMNSPHSSHMGGSWERHIRTIRNILNTMLHQHSGRLDTSTLRTFLYEAMAIVNSRPLTSQDLSDPQVEPLSPNQLLTMKSKLILPPPGQFEKEDLYARRRWRRAQYLAGEFWQRWKKEYLAMLQSRQKWHKRTRNVRKGDIVILKDDSLVRGQWRLARVLETILDDDQLVRRVKIQIGDQSLSPSGSRQAKPTILERPIHKLTLILESESD